MKPETLKHEIIEWINQTNDKSLLKMLKAIKDSNDSGAADWYEELEEEDIASIARGIDNHEKGEVLTSKEFWSQHGNKV